MNDRAFSNIAVVVWNNFIQVLVLEWVLISIDCFRIFKNVRKYRNQVCLTENMFYMKLETETKTWGKTFLSVNYLLKYHQSILFRVLFTSTRFRRGRSSSFPDVGGSLSAQKCNGRLQSGDQSGPISRSGYDRLG